MKEVLESKLETPNTQLPGDLIQTVIELTKQINTFQQVALLDKNGHVLYSENETKSNEATDQSRIQEVLLTYELTGQWFKPLPTPGQADALDILTPIFSHQETAYVLKTTITLDNLKNAFVRTYRFVFLIFLMVVVFAFFLVVRVKRKILDPIRELAIHTGEIAQGHLDHHVDIHTGDEIENLANSFNDMAEQLSLMKNKAEDSNPLTHLPGNHVIEAEIERRLKTGGKVAALYCDLDRFKIYNDLYGIQRGDEVIQMTADVLQEAVKAQGGPGDVVAHEGGDDFVVVTIPSRMRQIADEIINRFDEKKKNHYRKVDSDRGHIFIKDRRAKDPENAPLVPIPLMSISIAAVTNEKKSYGSYKEIANEMALLKKKAKLIKGSAFVNADDF